MLHALISGWPGVVSKEQFSRKVWNGGMSDEGLARSMTQLRHALSAIEGISIRSVYGRGYQLRIQVSEDAVRLPTEEKTHSRLIDMARAPTQLAESLLHARHLLQVRSRSAMLRAEAILIELLESAPAYMPAKVAYGECMSCMISNGWEVAPEKVARTLALLAEVERQAPETAGLRSQRAHLLDCIWRYDEAAPLHQQALQNEPDDPASHYNHAWHLAACGRMEDALAAIRKAHELGPYSLTTFIMLARIHLMLGNPDQARWWGQRACTEHPESSQAYVFWLSLEAYFEPRDELAERADTIELSVLSWSFAPASLAFVMARCGYPEKARAFFTQWDRDNHSIHALHMFALLEVGDLDKAFDMFTKATELGCGFLPLALRMLTNSRLREHPHFEALWQQVFANLPSD